MADSIIIRELVKSFKALQAFVMENFGEVEKKLDKHEKKLEKIEQYLESVRSRPCHIITDPDGNEIFVENLSEFCENHFTNKASAVSILSRNSKMNITDKSYKGYFIRTATAEEIQKNRGEV